MFIRSVVLDFSSAVLHPLPAFLFHDCGFFHVERFRYPVQYLHKTLPRLRFKCSDLRS